MLSYRHAFHAGNHADVLKHLVLVNTLHYAIRKESPVFYLDTHAGAGQYRLQSPESLKTGEAEQGILKVNFAGLYQQLADDPKTALQCYQDAVAPFLQHNQYPGSPLIAASVLRKQDHLHWCELHPTDFEQLHLHNHDDPRIRIEKEDGYQRALALLPPVQKRAVVLIDPSYEVKEDYRKVVRLLADIHQRMRSTQILLWYPVVERADVDYMISALQRSAVRDLWQFELGVSPDGGGHGLTASGMLVVNPPFTLPGQLRALLPLIQQQLAPGYGHWAVKNLTGE
jgi:23S rRNA (adenine2030-N6)-methyltransferase